jgi:hypothetical protein
MEILVWQEIVTISVCLIESDPRFFPSSPNTLKSLVKKSRVVIDVGFAKWVEHEVQ